MWIFFPYPIWQCCPKKTLVKQHNKMSWSKNIIKTLGQATQSLHSFHGWMLKYVYAFHNKKIKWRTILKRVARSYQGMLLENKRSVFSMTVCTACFLCKCDPGNIYYRLWDWKTLIFWAFLNKQFLKAIYVSVFAVSSFCRLSSKFRKHIA